MDHGGGGPPTASPLDVRRKGCAGNFAVDPAAAQHAVPASLAALPAMLILLSSALAVRLMTPAAESYVRRARPIAVTGGRLFISDARLRVRLLPALARCAGPGSSCPQDQQAFCCEWRDPSTDDSHRFIVASMTWPCLPDVRVQRLTALFVDAGGCPADPIGCYAERYRLSPTERRLLALLTEGHDLKVAASRLGQQVSTTRTVLKSIFSKTDTHRQSQLVAAVLDPSASQGRHR